MFSQATILGTLSEDGLQCDSALYFYDFGYGKAPFKEDRIAFLRESLDTGRIYERIKQHDNWIRHLTSHIHKNNNTNKHKLDIIKWAKQTKVNINILEKLLDQTNWGS